jgi:uncharacterized protein
LAGVLPAPKSRDLEQRLAAYEDETGHQIVVLTIPTLESEPIEQFTLRVAETWKIGHKGIDNGIILLVAVEDRAARIEVGYGLEGVVPDVIAKRVLEDVMFPEFRRGRIAEGIDAGVGAVMQAARGETVTPPRRRSQTRGNGKSEPPISSVLFASFIGAVAAASFAGRKQRAVSALLGGVLAGGVAYWLVRVLAWAVAAFALGAVFAAMGLAGPGRRGGGLSSRRGWGGGFGGGGFGGGGGGFGGGGASGRW